MKKNRNRLISLFVMCLGTCGVFALLIYMNELTQTPDAFPRNGNREISLTKQTKKKPPTRTKQKKKLKKRQNTTPRAPAPRLDTALSGLNFDLPQFEVGDLMGTNQLLAGRGGNASLVMTADTVDQLPKPRVRVSPEYPRRAIERGIEGSVLLKIKITERGDVDNVRVVQSKPPGIFENAALVAVRQWSFEPGTYKGEPVSVSVDLPMPFRLTR